MSRWIKAVSLLVLAAALPFVMVRLDDAGLSATIGDDLSSLATALAVALAARYFTNKNSSTGEPPGFSERLRRVGVVAAGFVVFVTFMVLLLVLWR